MRPPESWSRARVTLALTVVTAIVWVLLVTIRQLDWAAQFGGFIPARAGVEGETGRAPFWLTPLTATLVHADLVHLAFNLLILVFCGRPTEAVAGPVGLLILYVVGAFAAAGAHYVAASADPTPMVGASGAISAVLGAYAVLFGRNRVRVSNPTLALWLNALWLMAAWLVLQLIVGISFSTGGGAQIAIAAHIGGFLAGVALAYPLLMLRYRKA